MKTHMENVTGTTAALRRHGASLAERGDKFPVHFLTGQPAITYLAAELGIPAWRLTTTSARSEMEKLRCDLGSIPVLTLSNDVLTVARMADHAVAHGIPIPRKWDGKVSFERVASICGVAVDHLLQQPKMRAVIDYWDKAPMTKNAVDAGSTAIWPSFPTRGTGRQTSVVPLNTAALRTLTDPDVYRVKTSSISQDLATLDVYILELERQKVALPALPGNLASSGHLDTDDELYGKVDLAAISSDCRFGTTISLRSEPLPCQVDRGCPDNWHPDAC